MEPDSSVPHSILLAYWYSVQFMIWQIFSLQGGTSYGILLNQHSKTPFKLG